jgi:D-alanyl-D-alanine carboxypeptidase (penicillin-binding protein 5/6)
MRYLTLALFLLSSLGAKPLRVEVTAPSAILMNAETGAILYAKNPHEKRYPASLTKVATALYVIHQKQGALDEIAVASKNALHSVPAIVRQAADTIHPPYRLEHDGTIMGLRVGEEHTLLTFLYGLMLPSGNDAANVLAEHLSGSVEKFMQELNPFMKSLGLKETHFVNPHGLHHPDHWTTAFDMAILTKEALKSDLFKKIVKSSGYPCPKSSKQPARVLVQNNRLLRQGPFFYPKAIGVKTGHHAKAARPIVAAATHEGRVLIAVLLGTTLTNRYSDAIRLFEAAFAEKQMTRVLFSKESERFNCRIKGKELIAALKSDLVLQYFPAEESGFLAEIEWKKMRLPINKGEEVGSLRLMSHNNQLLQKLPLYAIESVSEVWWRKALSPLFVGVLLCGGMAYLLFQLVKKRQKVV